MLHHTSTTEFRKSFHEVSVIAIRERLKVLLQMSAVMTYGSTLPVIKVGRIAGQFAKPRSSPTEILGGVEMPSFRGHAVHSDEPTLEARTPDPERLVQAYYQAVSSLNLLRAFTKGGFADLTQVHTWNQEFVASSLEGRRYETIANEIGRALRFMQAIGIDLGDERSIHEVDVWTSHEALLLDYEEPLVRKDSTTGDWYACSGHFLWVGERTRQPDGAHVEFLSGLHNPVGAKVGPTMTPDELVALCERLNPDRSAGRLTLIARLGASRVQELLPPLLRAVREAGMPVVWVCDPMHANGFVTGSGHKTRRLDDVLDWPSIARGAGGHRVGLHLSQLPALPARSAVGRARFASCGKRAQLGSWWRRRRAAFLRAAACSTRPPDFAPGRGW